MNLLESCVNPCAHVLPTEWAPPPPAESSALVQAVQHRDPAALVHALQALRRAWGNDADRRAADLDRVGPYGLRAVQLSVSTDVAEGPAMLDHLLSAGASFEGRGWSVMHPEGLTLAQAAVRFSVSHAAELLEVLQRHHALDVHQRDSQGNTLLHLALSPRVINFAHVPCDGGLRSGVVWLLDHQGDALACNRQKQSVLDVATTLRETESSTFIVVEQAVLRARSAQAMARALPAGDANAHQNPGHARARL